MKVYNSIIAHLDQLNIKYIALEHEPTPTSEDSARARKEPIEIGGKAPVLKTDNEFRLVVLSGSHKLDSASTKKIFKSKKIRFATQEELLDITGLKPGSVPPFGEPILPIPLYVDQHILQNNRIAFNAGSVCHSIILNIEDYEHAAKITEVAKFAK